MYTHDVFPNTTRPRRNLFIPIILGLQQMPQFSDPLDGTRTPSQFPHVLFPRLCGVPLSRFFSCINDIICIHPIVMGIPIMGVSTLLSPVFFALSSILHILLVLCPQPLHCIAPHPLLHTMVCCPHFEQSLRFSQFIPPSQFICRQDQPGSVSTHSRTHGL